MIWPLQTSKTPPKIAKRDSGALLALTFWGFDLLGTLLKLEWSLGATSQSRQKRNSDPRAGQVALRVGRRVGPLLTPRERHPQGLIFLVLSSFKVLPTKAPTKRGHVEGGPRKCPRKLIQTRVVGALFSPALFSDHVANNFFFLLFTPCLYGPEFRETLSRRATVWAYWDSSLKPFPMRSGCDATTTMCPTPLPVLSQTLISAPNSVCLALCWVLDLKGQNDSSPTAQIALSVFGHSVFGHC